MLEQLETRQLLSLTIQIDYRFDQNNFFVNHTERQAILQSAADSLASQIATPLAAITPDAQAGNTWTATPFDPSNDSQTLTINNLSVPADTIIIYAGGESTGFTGELGIGGPGGASFQGNSLSFVQAVEGRGLAGALLPDVSQTAFGPWGGTVSFDTGTNWYFGSDPTQIGADQIDFFSVAEHEIAHVLGFGTAPSWENRVSGSTFSGPAVIAEQGGPVATDVPAPNAGHWALGTLDHGLTPDMLPSITSGVRTDFTPLDFAGLADMGWQIQAPTPSGLTAVDQINQVSLTWAPVTGVNSYNVYRSTTPGGEGITPFATGLTSPNFVDPSVVAGTGYYYQVSAVSAAGESSLSAEASVLAAAEFQNAFSGPASSLPAPWQTVLGGGFSINSSDQAVSAPIVQGLFKAATVRGLSLTDVSVSAVVGLNATPANGTSAAAVIVRSQDANDVNNCYFAALTPAPGGLDQILIEKVINGQITGIAAKALPAGTASGTLTLDVFGNTLAAYLNGQLEVIGTDSTYTTAGQVGIGAQDQGATFANFVASALVTPPVPFADDFSRPASVTLGDPWYVNYVVPPNSSIALGGGFGINGSEQAVSLTAGFNVASLFGVSLSSPTVSAMVVNAGSGAGVVADWNNANQSGYGLLWSGSTLQLYKVTNGNATTLGLPHAAAGSTGVVGLQVAGGTLSVFFNGGLVFSLNDATFTSGSAGLMANGAGAAFSSFALSGP